MNEELLTRISDALELIADTLVGIEDHLHDLAECITERNQFCIAGSVTTYEP